MKYQSLIYFVASIVMKRAGGLGNCEQCRVLNPDPDSYRDYREADSLKIGKQHCRVLKLADKPSCLEGGDQGTNAG